MVIVGGSALRSLGFFIHDIYWFQEALGGDKVTHVLMGSMLFVAILLLITKVRLFVAFCSLSLFLILEECLQLFHPSREFSFVDMGMSLLGVTVATLVFVLYRNAVNFLGRVKAKERVEMQTNDS